VRQNRQLKGQARNFLPPIRPHPSTQGAGHEYGDRERSVLAVPVTDSLRELLLPAWAGVVAGALEPPLGILHSAGKRNVCIRVGI
jgi:hypothetical protein